MIAKSSTGELKWSPTEETYVINKCSCGCDPDFVQPEYNYTDVWLECPNCHKRTRNTGGYHYGMEISLKEAKIKAIKEWNEGKIYVKEGGAWKLL